MNFSNIDKLEELTTNVFEVAVSRAFELKMLRRNEMSRIPELENYAEEVCAKIMSGLFYYYDDSDDKPTFEHFNEMVGQYCICAGMGAVCLWADGEDFEKHGLFEMLTAKSGIYGMDHYVYKKAHMDCSSEECKTFVASSFEIFDTTFTAVFEGMKYLLKPTDEDSDRFYSLMIMEVCRLMYRLGITIQTQVVCRSHGEEEYVES